MLLDTLDGVSAPGVRRVVAVEPASACNEVRALVPPDVVVVPQVEGGLGPRMRDLMAELLAAGAAVVALVGSDLPDITPQRVLSAFTTLAEQPDGVVLGPATDGGYYLIAATHVPDVFEGIEWGTARVLRQTQAAARRAGLPVRLLDPMSDVDSPADLATVSAARTAAWVRRAGITGQRPLSAGQV